MALECIPFCTHFVAIFPMASSFPVCCFDTDRAPHIHILFNNLIQKSQCFEFFATIALYLHIHNQFLFWCPFSLLHFPWSFSPFSRPSFPLSPSFPSSHSLLYHHILPPAVHHEKVFTSASAA